MSDTRPTLWHISLSHYSEKVRWALDHKRIPHRRRAVIVPGAHMCADHVEVGGLVFPTRRWVRPVGPGNRPLPGPTLVSLQLSEIEVE